MNYYELRKIVARIIPRMTRLSTPNRKAEKIREKGRKKNYSQFNLRESEWRKQERLLNTEEINSFLEISVRAPACPMPFNMDIWDGLKCIAEGQLVNSKRGYIPIEEIEVGDEVISYNEHTKILEWKLVEDRQNSIRSDMLELETENGSILLMTDDHPVYTNRGWVEAKDLNEDDELMVKIKSIRKFSKPTKVYDITVKDNHNFFAEGILVHNCPFGCIYCYADSFRASLYTSFFDNSKTMGFRHCNPDYYKKEMEKMNPLRKLSFDKKKELSGINKAYALEIPVRMGIRFEDFLRSEGREGVSLTMLQYLAEIEYPVMLNTKSDLVGTDPYVRALADNPAKTAVHMTAITSNEEVTKSLERGAPAYVKRLEAIKSMTQAGIRVVARIEPYLFLLTDDPDEVNQYAEDMWEAGVRNITFDTYSYTGKDQGIRQSFMNAGYDFDRIFMAGCDSQPLGSILLGKFMDLFREQGFKCSTFDIGNAPDNDDDICCEVGDWFEGGFSYGCTVMAARFIVQRKGEKTSWSDFETYVYKHGGFLTEDLRQEVKLLWNLEGNFAYSHSWARGLSPVGKDEDGLLWTYEDTKDYRETLIESLL